MKISFIRTFLICFFITISFSAIDAQNDTIMLTANDGPYIIHKENSTQYIQVEDGELTIKERANNQPFWVTSHDGKHKFEVRLHKIERPQWRYEQPDKMLILSDPHGNLEAFLSVLNSQGIINNKYEWNWGKGHLFIIGDVFDRGDDVLPIFWLIYKLEAEALKAGGQVHFVLGNHEEMILRNNIRYTNKKYKNLAEKLGIEYRELWNRRSELGYWLMTRNTIEVIGNNLFVHAGLSKEFLEDDWQIPQLNEMISSFLYMTKEQRENSADAKFLFGSNGPIWYRGMVRDDEKYNPLSEENVDKILQKYNVGRIYVGHTIFDEVSRFYDGKVIGVNVSNQKNMDAGKSRGILVDGLKTYIIYDTPGKRIEIH